MANKDQTNLSQQAKEYIKSHKREIARIFADPEKFPPSPSPFSFFMAGSPGAGKTEFSKRLIEIMSPTPIVRIDADEIRKHLPQYTGRNSDVVQGAASIGVDNLHYFVLKHKQNSIMDGTFAHYTVARKNVLHCLKKKRHVSIFYLYQDPIAAWDFTQKREKLEGRRIPKQSFVEAFFKSKENVDLIKKEFGDRIEVSIVVKSRDNSKEEIKSDVHGTIDDLVKIPYTQESLNSALCSTI